MQLLYRGIHYTINASHIAITPGEVVDNRIHDAKYRGATYQRQRVAQETFQSILELKYRGVSYLTGTGMKLYQADNKNLFQPALAPEAIA
ncbi:DUF4278 domain-containing protein [Brasilonema sp. UFV-L1]|uniref:DUF4278 domain-containing protein n=1 Tax=Brasilonema sp. UFV-L1 TaxID=2234130 RepID=UPI00145FB1A0|nr:DUF4278 domain-containing protein [Brasilonema sp. UFV-L1]NMG07185.1 hypothetical protein [Brasilonema sp. UFV-L1]